MNKLFYKYVDTSHLTDDEFKDYVDRQLNHTSHLTIGEYMTGLVITLLIAGIAISFCYLPPR